MTIDAFVVTPESGPSGLAIHDDGTIYVCGTAQMRTRGVPGHWRWIVRRGSNHGTYWETVDDFTSSSSAARAQDLILSGNRVYVVGGVLRDEAWYSTVREGVTDTSGGVTWATIDELPSTTANAVAVDSLGQLYVGGMNDSMVEIVVPGPGKKTKVEQKFVKNWIVRRRDPSGNWATIDVFRLHDTSSSIIADIAIGAGDTLWASGYPYDANGNNWMTRAMDPSGTWRISDFVPGEYCLSIMADSAGNVFAGGGTGQSEWLIRALAAP